MQREAAASSLGLFARGIGQDGTACVRGRSGEEHVARGLWVAGSDRAVEAEARWLDGGPLAALAREQRDVRPPEKDSQEDGEPPVCTLRW